MNKNQNELAEFLIKSFVYALITEMPVYKESREKNKQQISVQEQDKKIITKQLLPLHEKTPLQPPMPIVQFKPFYAIPPFLRTQRYKQPMPQAIKTVQKNIPKQMRSPETLSPQIQVPKQPQVQKQPVQESQMPKPSSQLLGIGLGRLRPLLSNKLISSIECPGPDKQLIVNKRGQIAAISESLTRDEIELIMKEISNKTRIPLEPGIFKAALGDIIITAIISDYAGTRFVIEKLYNNNPPSQIYQ